MECSALFQFSIPLVPFHQEYYPTRSHETEEYNSYFLNADEIKFHSERNETAMENRRAV